MYDFIEKLGTFFYPLAFLSITSLALILERLYYIRRSFILKHIKKEISSLDTKKAQSFLRESYVKYNRINVYLGIIATVSPLLGLLGTVSGMVKIFYSLSFKMDDPKILSLGIGQALYTTVYGLIIAIPSYIAYKFFQDRLRFYYTILYNELDLKDKTKKGGE